MPVESLRLKFGSAPDLPPADIPLSPVTLFVGPNNSGKSKILQEINQYCTSGQIDTQNLLLDHLTFSGYTDEESTNRVDRYTLTPRSNEAVQPDHIIVGKGSDRLQVRRGNLVDSLLAPSAHLSQFCQWYLKYNTLILDGPNRINLVNQQGAGDLQEPPHTSFQALFRDNKKREEVRRIVKDAFDLSFVLDPTHLGQLRVRLSERDPTDESEERGIVERSVSFHSAALPIEKASDGVKAFTGIITEVMAGDPEILLIDEPEAFLHPSLSFKLGQEIAKATSGTPKRLFVSTHSPNFVMGCIQSGTPINIVRLTYRQNVATARLLPSANLLRLMRNPLLRSTGVINGLFYEFVVVTEGDSDRAFYEEINKRLVDLGENRGIPNCLFLNAQNKQTIGTIVSPLRSLGIPTAGIVDVDVLKEGGAVWTKFLSSGFIPEPEHQGFRDIRNRLMKEFKRIDRNMKTEGGVELLEGEYREAANNLFERLAEYGWFTVRIGELEKWLPNLGAAGHGSDWLVSAFRKMGESPKSSSYVRPSNSDVWAFIDRIRKWMMDAARKGIPN